MDSSWEPYTIAMEDHQLLLQPSSLQQLDHTQIWLPKPNNYNYNLDSTQHLLPPSPNPLTKAEILGSDKDDPDQEEEEEEQLAAMKEMMFKIAAMQPVDIDPATVRRPRRRNVRISEDPQSVAARLRRERISEKMRILQRLVPGGTKMDTASMLDEAIRYLKFLKRQIRILQGGGRPHPAGGGGGGGAGTSTATYSFDDINNDDQYDSMCFNRRFV